LGRACSTHRKKRNEARVFTVKPKWKKLLGRSMHTWVNNVKTDLKEIGLEGVNWIRLAQNREK
jgi:hypothetical protein